MAPAVRSNGPRGEQSRVESREKAPSRASRRRAPPPSRPCEARAESRSAPSRCRESASERIARSPRRMSRRRGLASARPSRASRRSRAPRASPRLPSLRACWPRYRSPARSRSVPRAVRPPASTRPSPRRRPAPGCQRRCSPGPASARSPAQRSGYAPPVRVAIRPPPRWTPTSHRAHSGRNRSPSWPPLARGRPPDELPCSVLAEPHVLELLVRVMIRRRYVILHLRPVHHASRPPDTRDVVHMSEHDLLDLTDELLPLRGVQRPRLAREQVVDPRIGESPPVVGVARRVALEELVGVVHEVERGV